MHLRRYLNAAFQVMVEGADRNGVIEIERTLNKPPQAERKQTEDTRRQHARDNRQAISNLADAFALGRS